MVEELVPQNLTSLEIESSVKRFPSGEVCKLAPLTERQEINEADIQRFIDICNQPRVYSTLFEPNLKGRPYDKDWANDFINSAKRSWTEKKSFCYLVRNINKDIVAVASIKSSDLSSSEIGFWSSEDYSGVMTNTVNKLCELAKQAGFIKLTAKTQEGNTKSLNVLSRAGFSVVGEFEDKGKKWKLAEKVL